MNPYEAPLPLPYIIRDNRITYLSFGSFFKKWWKPILGVVAAVAIGWAAPPIAAAILSSTGLASAVSAAGLAAGLSASTIGTIGTGLSYLASAAVGAGFNVVAQATISGGFEGWQSAAIGGAFAGIAGQFTQTGGFDGMFGTTGGPGGGAAPSVPPADITNAAMTGNSGVPSLMGSTGTAATGSVDTLVATSAPSAGVPIIGPHTLGATPATPGAVLGNASAANTASIATKLGGPPSVLNPYRLPASSPGFDPSGRLLPASSPGFDPSGRLLPASPPGFDPPGRLLPESNFFADVATDLGKRWDEFDATGALINAGLTTAGNIAASALTGPSPEQEEYLRQQAAEVASLKKQQDARREFLIQQARRGPGILPGQSAAAAAGAYRASQRAGIRRLDPNARAAAQRYVDRIASQKGQTQHAQALLYNQRASQAAAGLWPAATSVADKITGLSKAQEAIDAKQQADTDNLASTFATWMTPTPEDEDDKKDT